MRWISILMVTLTLSVNLLAQEPGNTALMKGRVVDADGVGIGGVRIEARPWHPSYGPDDSVYPVEPTAEDGSWSWEAPAHTTHQLTFIHPKILQFRVDAMVFRPGETYDFGVQTAACPKAMTFRLVSPGGLDLTPYAIPSLMPDPDGWYHTCVREFEEILGLTPYRAGFADLSSGISIPDGYDGSPIEITTSLHSILRVQYPDGTPVAGARIRGEYKTNARGECAIGGEDYPAGETVWIYKGDYSVSITLGEGREAILPVTIPRGGDLEFVLTSTEPVRAPISWGLIRVIGEEEDGSAFNCLGQSILTIENLKPGTHTFESYPYFGVPLHTATVVQGQMTRQEVPIPALRRFVRARVVTAAGAPVPHARIQSPLMKTETDGQGRVDMWCFVSDNDKKSGFFQAEHDVYGYFEGRVELLEDGSATVRLEPWCTLQATAMDPGGKRNRDVQFRVTLAGKGYVLWSIHQQNEVPWDQRGWSAVGDLQLRLRSADYEVTASHRGWSREETIALRAGATGAVSFRLPHLRAVTIKILDGEHPAKGEIVRDGQEFEGWQSRPVELDAEGHAILYTPALDPSTPIEFSLDERRSWTIPVDGSIELQLEEESPGDR